MLIKEVVAENTDLVRFYSDSNFMIHKIGTDEYYGEAIELATTQVEYEETDIPIDEEETEPTENATEEDYQAALQEFGVDLNA